jgi:hypothetical protein
LEFCSGEFSTSTVGVPWSSREFQEFQEFQGVPAWSSSQGVLEFQQEFQGVPEFSLKMSVLFKKSCCHVRGEQDIHGHHWTWTSWTSKLRNPGNQGNPWNPHHLATQENVES